MSKVLVSGSHGFIGSHLVKALEKRGDTVIPLKRDLLLDATRQQVFTDEMKPDYIFHLSAFGQMYDQKDIDTIFITNLYGTFNLLKATRHLDYKAFINVSSSSVTLPHQTMYSATKMGAEHLCRALADEYDKPIVSIRPYSVYGTGEVDFRFIPTVFRSCLTGEAMTLSPDATHDWIYIGDIIENLLNLTDGHDITARVIGYGTGRLSTNKEIVSMIEKITGKRANIKEEKQLRSFDNDYWKAKNGEGIGLWTTRIEDGLKKCYPYYKKRYATK